SCCVSLFRCIYLLFYFFFFQAEDGIRDATVTGVQTCALPISILADQRRAGRSACATRASKMARRPHERSLERRRGAHLLAGHPRSEERRVGKECRSRRSEYNGRKKERNEK